MPALRLEGISVEWEGGLLSEGTGEMLDRQFVVTGLQAPLYGEMGEDDGVAKGTETRMCQA
jgi:hypothetical protein